jgi:phosphate transport system substrate-binding protein
VLDVFVMLRPALTTLLLLTACRGPSDRVVVQNKGSDTMVNLAQAWAEAFVLTHPRIAVEVSGGGSGTGIAALIQGSVDIANSSRAIRPEEAKAAFERHGRNVVGQVVALDALAVFVHSSNPTRSLSFDQLACIFGEGGTCESWSDLGVTVPGCRENQIIRVSRQSNSGTFQYFRETVVGPKKDLRLGSLDLNGSSETIRLVENTPCAIGYVGMGYLSARVKPLCISRGPDQPCVPPTALAARRHEYPITRPLFMYTLENPTGAQRTFLDWVGSDEGLRVLERTGYVAVEPVVAASEAP